VGKWRIYKRRGAALRKITDRHAGSKWEIHKSYATEADAIRALKLLTSRNTMDDGFKLKQFMLVIPGQHPPKILYR
jgi:hypothetical protein